MKLCFDPSEIQHYADLYDKDYDTPMEQLVPKVKEQGYLTADDLLALSDWKNPSGRNTHNIEKNDPIAVEELTHDSFNATNEYDRIKCLLRLKGVSLAVGSAILHWFYPHGDLYPIWDFRARESVGFNKHDYPNWRERWYAYVNFCQITAQDNGVDMRTLDRALWRYSKVYNSLKDITDETLITELERRGYNLSSLREKQTTAKIVKIS